MRETRILMGMPITVEVLDCSVFAKYVDVTETNEIDTDKEGVETAINAVFAYFEYVDEKFSTYKDNSEISLINRKELTLERSSYDMQRVFALCEETKQRSNGYFDIARNGGYDPSGLVKGWAVQNAAMILQQTGFANFYVEAGGDVQVAGKNHLGRKWRVGIRNPFDIRQIVKVLSVSDCGVATSGNYIRGQHIYNPKNGDSPLDGIVSLTVIGPNIYEADRFATAAFAMGREGIFFIEELAGFEGYLIDGQGQATFTSGFVEYVSHD